MCLRTWIQNDSVQQTSASHLDHLVLVQTRGELGPEDLAHFERIFHQPVVYDDIERGQGYFARQRVSAVRGPVSARSENVHYFAVGQHRGNLFANNIIAQTYYYYFKFFVLFFCIFTVHPNTVFTSYRALLRRT